MNDESEKKLAADTPADTLHAHAMNHIALPEENKFDNEPLMDEVTSHPNLQSNTIKELFDHATAHGGVEGQQEAGNMSNEQLGNLLNHPNAPLGMKQQFTMNSWHPDNANSDLHEQLADSGIMDDAQLQTLANNALSAGAKPHAYKHLSPSYYLNKFKARSQQDPEGLNENDKEAWSNEVNLGREGLLASSKHTPQTLEQTIDAFSNAKHGHSGNRLMKRLAEERQDLSKEQLSKIHQIVDASSDDDHYSGKDNAIDAILQHKNVDPTLLSKYAVGKDTHEEALKHPNLPRESINAFIKRVKDPNGYESRGNVEALLKNPNVTKDDVAKLIAKGSSAALKDERADESAVRAHWNTTDKGLESARSILSAAQTPPDVLKDLVNHKNQEVAIQALNHPRADMSVVQEGLKRKAKNVQDAARVHPLVAATEAREGLMSGKVGLTKAYEDPDFASHFDQMPAMDQAKVFASADEKYRGDKIEDISKKAKERSENVIFSKYKLASDPRAPKVVRDAHAADLANIFRDKIGKNSEPNEMSNTDILSENHKSDNGRIIKAVVDLAKQGNKEAQSAILENPGMLTALKGHMDYSKAPSDFLEDIYNKSKQYAADGTTVYSNGQPKPFDEGADVAAPLFASPNLPEHVFQEMASNKDVMEKIGQGDEMNRYNDLPEADQDAKYQAILNSGSQEAKLSILRAKAPQRSWDAAFAGVDEDSRRKFLSNHMFHVQQHRPDIFKNSALGSYESAGQQVRSRYGDRDPQSVAIQHLRPESLDEMNTLKQAISLPQDHPGYISDSDLMDDVPKKAYVSNDDIANHAFSAGRNELGYKMTAAKLARDIQEAPSPGWKAQPEDIAQVAADNQELLNKIGARVNEIPLAHPDRADQTDNPLAAKWSQMLHEFRPDSEYGTNDLKSLKDKGVSLDFLADMPGKDGEDLRQNALKANLISNDKLGELARSGTMEDVLAVGDGGKRQAMLQGYLQNPNITPEDLHTLASKMDHSFLNPEAFGRGRRTSMSPTGIATYNERLNNLIDTYQAKSPEDLPLLLENATHASKGLDALTQADTEAINKNMINHIKSKPYASPMEKNANLYSVLKSQGIQGSGGAAGVTLRSIEKEALATKDINLVIRMANDGDLTNEGTAALSKIAAQPGTLTAGQIADVSQTLDYDSDTTSVVGMAKAFDAKIALEPNSQKTAAAKVKFLHNLNRSIQLVAPGLSDKNLFVINYTKRAALDPHTEVLANNTLLDTSRKLAEFDVNQALDLYAGLPTDGTKLAASVVSKTIPEEMLNDPRFMEASATGWKLNLLANNAVHLTGANTSIMVNRALSPDGVGINHSDLFNRLENNEYALPTDSIKLGRFMKTNDFNQLVKSYDKGDNSMEGNMVFAAHARLGDLQAAMTDPNLAAPNAPMMGDEHRNHIMYNAHALSHVIASAKMKEDLANTKDKLSKISEMITTLHANVSAVADSLAAEAQKDTTNADNIARDNQFILSTAENIASTGLKLDRDDALKAMDLVGKFNNIRSIMGTDQNFEDVSKVVSNIVKRAENFEEQDWKQVFSEDPHAPFYLGRRESIPTEALNSIDYKSIEDAPHDVIGSNDRRDTVVQGAFAVESAKWFGKMSAEALSTHGKNLLHMYTRMQNDGKINLNRYSESMAEGMKYVGNQLTHKDTMNLLDSAKDQTVRQTLYRNAVANGVGGPETLKAFARDDHDMKELFSKPAQRWPKGEGANLRHKLEPVLKSPHIDDNAAGEVIKMFKANPEVMKESMIEMMKNKATPQKAVADTATQLLKNHKADYKELSQRASSDIASEVMQHPNVDESQMIELFNLSNENFPKYFTSNGKFNPALTNATHGGKLFRSIPIEVPKDVPNVETSKCVTNVSLQHKDYERMRDVMGLIPPEGMAWAEFKRKYPNEEKNLPQSVKAVFTSANNKPVMPEQFAEAMRSLDDNSKKYHLTYSHWTERLQIHRGGEQKPNLVVQINNSEESERNLAKDPKLWSLYQNLLLRTNGIERNSIGLHPTTPHLVSWSRVDTDQGKDAWAIEEYQSDFAQKFRKNLRSLMDRFPSGTSINGQHMTREDMEKYSKAIDKHLEDWADASMQAVIENAKAHGLKKLYMHGAEMRGKMSGGYSREDWDNPNTKPRTSGFRKIYQDAPPKYGFKECDYTDYPKNSSKMLKDLQQAKLSTKCWVLDLEPPKPKKTRKPASQS